MAFLKYLGLEWNVPVAKVGVTTPRSLPPRRSAMMRITPIGVDVPFATTAAQADAVTRHLLKTRSWHGPCTSIGSQPAQPSTRDCPSLGPEQRPRRRRQTGSQSS